MKFPKHQYVRSKKLLKAVSELECKLCGAEGMTQAAHTNWGGGKGRGIKADDNLIAALCQHCHHKIDQGSKLSKQERQDLWNQAHMETVYCLFTSGQWPDDVPLPDQYLRIFGNGASF